MMQCFRKINNEKTVILDMDTVSADGHNICTHSTFSIGDQNKQFINHANYTVRDATMSPRPRFAAQT
jgi:hypothetical protein